jgi:hypothetical protein
MLFSVRIRRLIASTVVGGHDAYPSAVKERILATCDWDDTLREQHPVAEGCKLNMAKAIVYKTDIVELIRDKLIPPKWLRGTVKRDQFQLKDGTGVRSIPRQFSECGFHTGMTM